MTDPEREQLLARIRELECSRGRWQWVALAALLMPMVCGSLLAMAWGIRLNREPAALRAERDRGLAAERAAAEVRKQVIDAAWKQGQEAEQAGRLEDAKEHFDRALATLETDPGADP